MQGIEAEPFLPASLQRLRKIHIVLPDLGAEPAQVVPVPAVPHHAVIAEREIILVAERPRLLRPVLYQPVVEIVKLLGMREIKGIALRIGLDPRPAVRAPQIRLEEREIQRLPVPVDLCGRKDVIVGVLQPVLLLHQRNDPRIHGFCLKLHVPERHRSDHALQIGAIRRRVQLFLIRHAEILEHRADLVAVFLLLPVELVRHIDVVPDLRDRHLRDRVTGDRIIPLMHPKLLLAAPGRVKIPLQRREIRLQFLQIHPLIGHLTEFHLSFLL